MGAGTRRISLPIIAVGAVFAFVYYTIIFLVIDPWLDLFTVSGLMNTLVFSTLGILALVSYTISIFKDPGSVPPHYFPEIEENSASLIQEVKRKGGELRYCQKCLQYKPPRTHHCRVCKRCVLRMDHHCIWINNCVGHFNYKSFLLLVFYIVLSLFYAVVLLVCQITFDFSKDEDASKSALNKRVKILSSPNHNTSVLLRILCLLLCFILLITVGILLIWNTYLLFMNKTTIEYHEGIRAKLLSIEKPNQIIAHPYDLGWFTNLIITLGPNFMCWFFPNLTNEPSDDGIHFLSVYDRDFLKNNGEKLSFS